MLKQIAKEYMEELRILEEIFYESERTSMGIHDFLSATVYPRGIIYLFEKIGDLKDEELAKHKEGWKKAMIRIKGIIEKINT